MNPLFDAQNKYPHNATPFDQIKPEHFMPAIEKKIEESLALIDQIKALPNPNFKNIIEALEMADKDVSHVARIFSNLHSAESSDELQDVAKELTKKMTEFENDISLDADLFRHVDYVYQQRDQYDLDDEQERLLEKTYKSFVRNGAKLSDSDKQTLRELDKEKSELSLKFGDNVLKETNSYKLFVENKEDLKGLPDGVVEAAAHAAEEEGKKGQWLFTLDHPSFLPLLMYAEKRELREKIYKAFSSRAAKDNEYSNHENVKKIANLRHQRAQLLGYNTHADYVLQERMAENVETVEKFLHELLIHAKPAAIKEVEELKTFAQSRDGLKELQAWDVHFYSEKLKKQTFDFDEEELKPYFKLENVIDGVFQVAKKLYGLEFKELQSIPKYHEDVKTYEVQNEKGEFVALFYGDFFPRPGKRNGAWMTAYKEQHMVEERDVRPHISIVCNFTKPTPKRPSLLTFDEVTTLFHEFGHALHGMLAKSRYESLSGTNVLWDFVELPSQILENWAYEKECLDLFAKHYESSELIPESLVEKVKNAANFHEARATLRQISFAQLDFGWHAQDPSGIDDVFVFEKKAFAPTQLTPSVEGASMSCSFGHIFQGGYSAAYYSYKWAEVLDADAFEVFKKNGIFDKTTAKSFHDNILSRGDSEHPMELFVKFKGDKPGPEALLRRAGLVTTTES